MSKQQQIKRVSKNLCPACADSHVDNFLPHFLPGEVIYPGLCLVCNARWNETYTLSSVEFTKEE